MHESRVVRERAREQREGPALSRAFGNQEASPPRWLTFLASADFLFAAWFLWMTPFETALSSWREAARVSSSAFATSPASTASRALRIAVLSEDLIDWLRWRAFSLVLIRLICDLMFATEASSYPGGWLQRGGTQTFCRSATAQRLGGVTTGGETRASRDALQRCAAVMRTSPAHRPRDRQLYQPPDEAPNRVHGGRSRGRATCSRSSLRSMELLAGRRSEVDAGRGDAETFRSAGEHDDLEPLGRRAEDRGESVESAAVTVTKRVVDDERDARSVECSGGALVRRPVVLALFFAGWVMRGGEIGRASCRER